MKKYLSILTLFSFLTGCGMKQGVDIASAECNKMAFMHSRILMNIVSCQASGENIDLTNIVALIGDKYGSDCLLSYEGTNRLIINSNVDKWKGSGVYSNDYAILLKMPTLSTNANELYYALTYDGRFEKSVKYPTNDYDVIRLPNDPTPKN